MHVREFLTLVLFLPRALVVMKRQWRVAAVTTLAIEQLEERNTGKDTTRTGKNSIHCSYLLPIVINRGKYAVFYVDSANVIK